MTDHEEVRTDIDLREAGLKLFSSISELREWHDREREYWRWLDELRPQDPNVVSQIKTHLRDLFQPIDQIANEAAAANPASDLAARSRQVKSRIEQHLANRRMVLSDAPEGKFIDELRGTNLRIAAYTTAAMLGVKLNMGIPESVEGSFLAFAYRHGFVDRTKSERESLEALYAEWSELLADNKMTFETATREYRDLIGQAGQQVNAQATQFNEFQSEAKDKFKVLLDISKQELQSIEQTYDQKLALQSAVVYWKKKAASHAKAAKALSWASGIVGTLVALLLGLWTFLAIGPLEKLSDVPIWKGAMLLLTAVVGVWAVRILVRLLLSNLHLKSDAVERRTMLLTYLALLRRGQGPSEEQRELILQILFRPSSTGIVKDDALPPAVAQWLNIVTSN